MSLLIDYFPLILFFGAYKLYGFFSGFAFTAAVFSLFHISAGDANAALFFATIIAILSSVLQIVILYAVKRLGKIHWIELAMLVAFGGMTLALRDPVYIQWKPTAIYLLFAVILLGGKFFWKTDVLRYVMKTLILPPNVWSKLTWAWSVFFVIMAVLNRVVADNFSMSAWIDYKLFGTIILFLVFALGQGLFLAKYIKETEEAEKVERSAD